MRAPRFTVRVVLILVAVAAITSEVARRWAIDPAASRLPAGSEAVLDPGQPGFYAVYTSAERYVSVPSGSRVRVLSDAQPSQIGPITHLDGTTVMGEYRSVRITVLDGEKAGTTGETSRPGLRP